MLVYGVNEVQSAELLMTLLNGRDAIFLQVGITAAQIIAFLRANAHPTTYAALNERGGMIRSVPITVADQIRLWEDERRRLIFYSAVVYSSFESEKEYFVLKGYVDSQGMSADVFFFYISKKFGLFWICLQSKHKFSFKCIYLFRIFRNLSMV